MGANRCGASFEVRKMAVGPSAPPIIAIDAASSGAKPSTIAIINANSAAAPGIVDAACQPIIERAEVYSGVYGRASINLYAFNSNGNKGIACGLNNLQKIKDGESLGGKSRAEDDFSTSEEEDFLG